MEHAMGRFKIIAAAILALLGTIIILQNTAPVETKLLFFSITMPRAILLMGTTLIGFALGVLVSLFFQRNDKPQQLPQEPVG
jgi:putative membrane protein